MQQWCAFQAWERKQKIEVLALRANASASLGDRDEANKSLSELVELRFPQVAAHKVNFEASAMSMMKKLRNTKIRFRVVDSPLNIRRRRG